MIKALDQLMQTRAFFWFRLAQFAAAIAVFTVAALMPSTYVAKVDASDHQLHFLGNLLLFLSASLACYGRLRLSLLILLLLPYSLLIELAQWLAPSRQVDQQDMLHNFAGLIAGLVIVYMAMWLWGRIAKPRYKMDAEEG